MYSIKRRILCLAAALQLICFFSLAQDDGRTQLPRFLSRTELSLNIGYINYPFSQAQLEPGFKAASIHIPHAGVGLSVLCYRFNKQFSTRLIYMRPANWVQYDDVNGDKSFHSVFLNILGLTAKYTLPLTPRFALYAEAGPALFTRLTTFKGDSVILPEAAYATLLAGGGIEYKLNERWKLQAGVLYAPARETSRQPQTLFMAGGFTYSLRPLQEKIVQRNAHSNYIFPRHLLQAGYSSNVGGYAVNRLFAEGAVPVFWSGDVRIRNGFFIQYQQNIYHGRKLFSLDWGGSISWWSTEKNNDHAVTFSLFPVFRFTLLYLRPFDFYFDYSAAGPTYISTITLDDRNTGKHFTFQDFMGIGIYAGKKRNLNAGLKIQHYSNGNIFTTNPGLQVPLIFALGYCF